LNNTEPHCKLGGHTQKIARGAIYFAKKKLTQYTITTLSTAQLSLETSNTYHSRLYTLFFLIPHKHSPYPSLINSIYIVFLASSSVAVIYEIKQKKQVYSSLSPRNILSYIELVCVTLYFSLLLVFFLLFFF